MTVRARFDGKVFVPIDPVDLRVDQLVELDIRENLAPPGGSPERLRQIMRQPPHLQPGDAAALEEAIRAGRRPARSGGVFDDTGK